MHLDPPWMILRRWCICVTYCLDSAFLIDLLVAPDPVCPHVRTVEVSLAGVKDHAMDCSLVAVFKVLDVLLHFAGRIDREDIAETRVVIERVAVNVVRRLLCRKKEDRASFGVGIVGFGCWGASIAETFVGIRNAYGVHQLGSSQCAQSRQDS
jgi:hypothetical protein